MKTPVNTKLLREAYAIDDGIPSEKIDMDIIAENKDPWERLTPPNETGTCGTVGCAIGWLGFHPKFQKLGLTTGTRWGEGDGAPYWNGRSVSYTVAARKLFGMTPLQAQNVFGAVDQSKYDKLISGRVVSGHKEIFQHRVRRFLASLK